MFCFFDLLSTYLPSQLVNSVPNLLTRIFVLFIWLLGLHSVLFNCMLSSSMSHRCTNAIPIILLPLCLLSNYRHSLHLSGIFHERQEKDVQDCTMRENSELNEHYQCWDQTESSDRVSGTSIELFEWVYFYVNSFWSTSSLNSPLYAGAKQAWDYEPPSSFSFKAINYFDWIVQLYVFV